MQISPHMLKAYPPYGGNGYTLGELKMIAKESGLHAFALKGDFTDIKGHLLKGRPIIVPINVGSDYITKGTLPFAGIISRYITKVLSPSYSHYVVAFGFDEKFIWIMDPVMGIRYIDISLFIKMWDGKQNAMLLVSS